jgi:hypothetical protein
MKYSEIRDWVINHIEHCSKEDMVELYENIIAEDLPISVNVEWDE